MKWIFVREREREHSKSFPRDLFWGSHVAIVFCFNHHTYQWRYGTQGPDCGHSQDFPPNLDSSSSRDTSVRPGKPLGSAHIVPMGMSWLYIGEWWMEMPFSQTTFFRATQSIDLATNARFHLESNPLDCNLSSQMESKLMGGNFDCCSLGPSIGVKLNNLLH